MNKTQNRGFWLAQLMISISILAILLPSFSLLTSKLFRQYSELPKLIYQQNELRYLEVFLRRDLQSATSIQVTGQRITSFYRSGDQVTYWIDGSSLKRRLLRDTRVNTAVIAKAISFENFSPVELQSNLLKLSFLADNHSITYQIFLPNAK